MPHNTEKDYYKILGIHFESSEEEIKAAYRELARLHHPDSVNSAKNPAAKPDPELFKAITEAYALLSNAEKRRKYDCNYRVSRFDSSVHWLKAKFQRSASEASEEAKGPETPQSRAWKNHQRRTRESRDRIQIIVMCVAGGILGTAAALVVFLVIRLLFIR